MSKINSALLFASLIIIAGCGPSAVQTVETTRIVLQTVVITQVFPQTVVVTRMITLTASTTPTPVNTPVLLTPTRRPISEVNATFQNGEVAIIQYYTLLGLGLFDKAYQLFSPYLQSQHSLDDYVAGAKQAFKTVKVLMVAPVNDYYIQRGRTPSATFDNWFLVEIYAEGQGNMSGSQMNGNQTQFVQVVQDANGDWLINQFATALSR